MLFDGVTREVNNLEHTAAVHKTKFRNETCLTHFYLASYKRDISKQCRPRSDATERGV